MLNVAHLEEGVPDGKIPDITLDTKTYSEGGFPEKGVPEDENINALSTM